MDVWRESAVEISKEFLRGSIGAGSFDAEEIVDLTDEDDEGDAGGEAADDRRGGDRGAGGR